MRILFSGPPLLGHLLPMAPTAMALRAAGHDVLFAGYGPLDVYHQSGFPTVAVGDGRTLADARARHMPSPRFTGVERTLEETIGAVAPTFAEFSRPNVAALLEVATSWSPDVIVFDAFDAAIPLVAARLGIPSVEHQFGLMDGRLMLRALADLLADVYAEHGVDPREPDAHLEIVPPSLLPAERTERLDPTSWQMRYVPYNGPGRVPAHLLQATGRRRVLVTLGTLVTSESGLESLVPLVREAAAIDAEFVLATGDVDAPARHGLTGPNITVLPWTPLGAVLPACDAIVHHGGSGTMMAAVTAGIPQLVLPQGADQFVNARAVQRHGFGLRAESTAVDAALLIRLLTDGALRAGARTVQAENAAQPSPAQVVGRFERIGGLLPAGVAAG